MEQVADDLFVQPRHDNHSLIVIVTPVISDVLVFSRCTFSYNLDLRNMKNLKVLLFFFFQLLIIERLNKNLIFVMQDKYNIKRICSSSSCRRPGRDATSDFRRRRPGWNSHRTLSAGRCPARRCYPGRMLRFLEVYIVRFDSARDQCNIFARIDRLAQCNTTTGVK